MRLSGAEALDKVLSQKQATGGRQPTKPGASRRLTVIPNLFAGDGRVHRFDANDQFCISRFLAEIPLLLR